MAAMRKATCTQPCFDDEAPSSQIALASLELSAGHVVASAAAAVSDGVEYDKESVHAPVMMKKKKKKRPGKRDRARYHAKKLRATVCLPQS
jgi:hypothetical protein